MTWRRRHSRPSPSKAKPKEQPASLAETFEQEFQLLGSQYSSPEGFILPSGKAYSTVLIDAVTPQSHEDAADHILKKMNIDPGEDSASLVLQSMGAVRIIDWDTEVDISSNQAMPITVRQIEAIQSLMDDQKEYIVWDLFNTETKVSNAGESTRVYDFKRAVIQTFGDLQ